HDLPRPDDVLAGARELGVELDRGASMVVARGHPLAMAEEDWRGRMLTVAERGARAVVPGTIVALAGPSDGRDIPHGHACEVLLLLPDPDEASARRAADAVMRELEASLQGFAFAIGRSRVAGGPGELRRAAYEALLAANVAETVDRG